MSKNQSRPPFDPIRAVKKLFLSGLVLFTFAVYVAYERLIGSDAVLAQGSAASTAGPVATATSGPLTFPGVFPTAAPVEPSATAAPALSQSGYRDGTYQGPAVDAYYGLVQVQVTIQRGNIQDVEFLQYPNDRRTSQEINAQVMPWLKQEAIQAQSANIDIISGATLTSEGFQMSLQSALQTAHHG